MGIVEAVQKAEGGELITNNFLKPVGLFLRYMGNGVFNEYEIEDGIPKFKYQRRYFSMAYILSIGWETVENKEWFT